MNIPIENQKAFIKKFEKIRPLYEDFATVLEQILTKAVGQYGYLGIVQARAKSVASFSSKIILKDRYRDPLTEMTDLCGARVILHFQSQVARICEFIRENFTIDEVNSLDLKSRLNVNEFGYRSVHYIVSPKRNSIAGINVPKTLHTLKAEIQVRTLAEHVWADISHDRLYKTELTIPEEWKRNAARLSAILEDADKDFAEMSAAIDSVNHVYQLQHQVAKARIDIEQLTTLAGIQQKDPPEGVKTILKLLSIYHSLNSTDEAKAILLEWMPLVERYPELCTRLRFEQVLIELTIHSGEFRSPDYQSAVREAGNLLRTIETSNREKRVTDAECGFLTYRFAVILQNNVEKSPMVLELISKAHELLPDNPLVFTTLLESILFRNIDLSSRTISLFTGTIQKTISSLQTLISLGIETVPAWFAIGRCYLFLGRPEACLQAYAYAVDCIMDENLLTSQWIIDDEIDRARRFIPLNSKLAEQIRLYLTLAMAVSNKAKHRESCLRSLRQAQLRKETMKQPVVIVAGGASNMDESQVENYRCYLEELMVDFSGTLISGGTTAGIPGLAGRVKSEIEKDTPAGFDLLAYLPDTLSGQLQRSVGYDHCYTTGSEEFSAMDILRYWNDVVLSGIHPSNVILVGINGGEIAFMEYRIALSFGAYVCLIANSGRAVSDFIMEPAWRNNPRLIVVPNDPLTMWALVHQSEETPFSDDELCLLAREVHQVYRKHKLQSLNPDQTDINELKVVMEWDQLDRVLQRSNRQQVAFYHHLLKRVNMGIRKADNPVLLNIKDTIPAKDYEQLAKLEHARWTAERLLDGWRYGTKKSIREKHNPCLVAWDQLDEVTKSYDFESVDQIPGMLKKAGYEIYFLNPGNV